MSYSITAHCVARWKVLIQGGLCFPLCFVWSSNKTSQLLLNKFCEWAGEAAAEYEWRSDPRVLPWLGAAGSRLLTPTPSRAACNAAVPTARASPCPTLSCQRSLTHCSNALPPAPHTNTYTHIHRNTHTFTRTSHDIPFTQEHYLTHMTSTWI